jgi:hypothetical protein
MNWFQSRKHTKVLIEQWWEHAIRSERIQVWIINRRLSTYPDGKAVQQPEPSFLNENARIKLDRARLHQLETVPFLHA